MFFRGRTTGKTLRIASLFPLLQEKIHQLAGDFILASFFVPLEDDKRT